MGKGKGDMIEGPRNLLSIAFEHLLRMVRRQEGGQTSNVFKPFGLRKGNGLVRNVPEKANVLDCVSEGLTLLLVPRDTEMRDQGLGMIKIVVIAIYFAIANAKEKTLRRGGAKKIKVVDPFKSGTDMYSIPNINDSIGNFPLKSGSRGEAEGEDMI